MADEQNNIIFGAEFDGQQITKGVDEVLNSLDKVREAESILKTSINETTAAMKLNRAEADKLSKSKPFDPKLIAEQATAVSKLNSEYDELVQQNATLFTAQKKVADIGKTFTKNVNEQQAGAEKLHKSIGRLTSINEIAADGVRKFGSFAKDAAFGLVSGFAGGIISSVLPAVLDFAAGIVSTNKELTTLQKNQAIVNGVFDEAAKAAGGDIAKLEVYKNKLNDTNIPAAERVKIAKEYNKTADETNKIDLKQIDNLEFINQKIEAQNKLILARAISTAALAELTKSASDFIAAQLKVDQALQDNNLTEEKVTGTIFKSVNEQIGANTQLQQSLDGVQTARNRNLTRQDVAARKSSTIVSKEIKDTYALIASRDQLKKSLEDKSTLLQPLITPEGLTTQAGQKDTKQIENVFQQKLKELQAKLAGLAASVFQSDDLIKSKFDAELSKEFADIAKLVKEKKLTIPQSDILKGLLQQINGVELSKSLEEFHTKQKDALLKIDDQLTSAILDSETKRIANIQDEFQREAEQIDQNYDATIVQLKKRRDDLIKAIDDAQKAGLIGPAAATAKRFWNTIVYGNLLDDAEQARNNAKAALAAKVFQKALSDSNKPFEDANLQATEDTTRNIRLQVGLYLEGKISYEKYQKELTKILKKEAAERNKVTLDELNNDLDRINKRLNGQNNLSAAEKDSLEKQRDALRKQISDLTRQIDQGVAGDDQEAQKKKIDQFIQYANAVQSLGQAVVGFWDQVNQAEAAALDRSIALQNKRVENAKEIAEAGNAEYLEMEQKRLDELTAKREANARKQLAINNALTASQAIVAAISAIAQATQTGSPIAAIAAVAAVIGAISAAYSFVNSLQPTEANFFTGVDYVQGPEGRDKVKANLTKGERVVPVKENKEYWDTLQAIQHRAIPAEHLNAFVENYPNNAIPLVDFGRLGMATEASLGGSSIELLNRVDKLNDTMGQMVTGLGELGINVSMDENGFEASIQKARTRRLRRSRS